MSNTSQLKADSENAFADCPRDPGPPEPVPAPVFSLIPAGVTKEPALPRILEQDLYLRLVPARSDTIVNQVTRRVIHVPGTEALHAVMDTRLVNIEWVTVFTRHNNTTEMEQHEERILTGLTVSNGTSATRELSIGAAFRGLGLSFGASRTTFSAHETTEEREVTARYNVPPRSSLFVYQRQYRFVQRVWWIFDGYNELWTVSANGTNAVLFADIHVTINADERLSSYRAITGTLAIDVEAGPRPEKEDNQRRRQLANVTRRARSNIEDTRASANTPSGRSLEVQVRENGKD